MLGWTLADAIRSSALFKPSIKQLVAHHKSRQISKLVVTIWVEFLPFLVQTSIHLEKFPRQVNIMVGFWSSFQV